MDICCRRLALSSEELSSSRGVLNRGDDCVPPRCMAMAPWGEVVLEDIGARGDSGVLGESFSSSLPGKDNLGIVG